MISKKKRLSHLFAPDGKSFVVAMDHPAFADQPVKGLDQPEEIIRCVVQAGADALLLPLGSASRYSDVIGRAGLWLSLDARPPLLERAVELALRTGAEGVKCLVYPWCDEMPDSLAHLTALGADCQKWGLPLMAEVIPGGFRVGPDLRTAEKIAAGARLAMEAGADVIKTFYTGDAESFSRVVQNCLIPVVVLGGDRAASDEALLQSVRGALNAGAAGVAIGRNVWQHPDPGRMAAALAEMVHSSPSDGSTRLL